MAYSCSFDFEAAIKCGRKLRKFKTPNNVEWFVQENWIPNRQVDSYVFSTRELRYSHELYLMSEEMDLYYAEIVIANTDPFQEPKRLVKKSHLCKKWVFEIPFTEYRDLFIPDNFGVPVFLRCIIHLFPLFHVTKPNSVCLAETSYDSPLINNDNGTLNTLCTDFKTLLEEGIYSDVVLVCGAVERKAHKNILAARSPVFAMMFNGLKGQTKNRKVTLLDMEVDVLEGMLNYIYSGTVTIDSASLARRLHFVAEKYDLEDLKILCFSRLLQLISE